MNSKGTILLYIMILMAVLLLGTTALVRTATYHNRISKLNYEIIKTEYLAQSGLNIAPRLFNEIPIQQAIPTYSAKSKEWIYAHLASAKKINQNLDGDIYLVRKLNNIYAIGMIQNTYCCILKATYQTTSENIQIMSWERI